MPAKTLPFTPGPAAEPLVARLTALADPARLRLLDLLAAGEYAVSEIAEVVQMPQSTVSRHLGMLYRAGVVSRRRDRNEVRYRVADPAFIEICRSVCLQIASRIDERAPLRDELLDFAGRH